MCPSSHVKNEHPIIQSSGNTLGSDSICDELETCAHFDTSPSDPGVCSNMSQIELVAINEDVMDRQLSCWQAVTLTWGTDIDQLPDN